MIFFDLKKISYKLRLLTEFVKQNHFPSFLLCACVTSPCELKKTVGHSTRGKICVALHALGGVNVAVGITLCFC